MTTLEKARITAKINISLSVILLIFMALIKYEIYTTHNYDLRWALLPLFAIYNIIGGILWLVGTAFSLMEVMVYTEGSKRLLIHNQAFPIAYFFIFLTSIILNTINNNA